MEKTETSDLVFKANIVATHLKDISFYVEHEIVVQLLQQRAELLEALKSIAEVSVIDATLDPCRALRIAKDAIQKAEQ